MGQYGFAFLGNRCNGCKTCMLACKDKHDLPEAVDYRKVYEYGGGSCRIGADGTIDSTAFAYYVSSACNHCSNAACVRVCPTGAMHKDSETGLVSVDEGRCVGCGYCEMACPYGCPVVDREKGHSVKCDGCADRVAEGKEPICVGACPQRALKFGDIGALRAEYGNIDAIAPLPDSSYTHPSVAIVEPAHAIRSNNAGGTLLNLKEVM